MTKQKKSLDKALKFLRKFTLKSNKISMRWRGKGILKPKDNEDLKDLYDFQCDVEEFLDKVEKNETKGS